MEELSPLTPRDLEILITAIPYAMGVAVAVASYRRSRFLSGHPIWRSVLIGVVAGVFWLLWLIVWWVNRNRIAEEWRQYHESKQPLTG